MIGPIKIRIGERNHGLYHPTTRVLTVLELLQAHGRLTGAEIAERLEINQRTVRRYITMLQDLGLPVEAERGRYGAYHLRDGFRLPPLMFTDDEALSLTLGLLAARRLGAVVGAASAAGALAKLERVMPASLRSRVQAVQARVVLDEAAPEVPPSTEVVVSLAVAATERRRVVLEYRDWAGNTTERPVDPYELVYRAGRWYVVGHCHLRGELRVLRLDRVALVRPDEAEFAAPPPIDAMALVERAIARTPGRYEVVVLLRVALPAAQRCVPAVMATLEEAAGGTLLRCYVQELDWFAGALAGFGWDFEVIEPPELRDELLRVAERVLAGARPPAVAREA